MVVVGTGGIGTRIIKTSYPVVEGLEAGTEKQTGRIMNLIPQESKVSKRDKEGL